MIILQNFLKNILKHKITSCIIAILIIVGGYSGYKAVKNSGGETQYALAVVEKGTIISSVSGNGQVSVLEQTDAKSKVSGDIAAVYVKKGDEVEAGEIIAKIDDTDFKKAVQEAETSLETAELELEELLSPPDELTLLQAENSLIQATKSKEKAEDALKESYDNGFNTVTNAFLDLPTVMTGFYDVLFSYSFNTGQTNMDYYTNNAQYYDSKVLQYRDDTSKSYQTARAAYDDNFNDYKLASRFSDESVIESLISETYETVKNIAETVKNANNLIQFYQDKLTERGLKPNSLSSTHLSAFKTYTSTINNNLSALLSAKSSIQNAKESITDAERSIKEKTLSFADLKAGADGLSIRAKKIAVQQKEDVLLTAKQDLANCYIRASFDGIVADLGVKRGDSASGGTVIATIITQQQIAEISLNEVDVAKVKVGQKVNLTFDAIDELNIVGEVSEIDALGTVSQGVVTYDIKIGFNTQDERVKPGMSVSVEIITDVKQDVLVIPNSAIKNQNNAKYVGVMGENNTVYSQTIETGISNDAYTEITNGLAEGDKIVTQTISNSSSLKTGSSSKTGGFTAPGGGSMEIMRIVR